MSSFRTNAILVPSGDHAGSESCRHAGCSQEVSLRPPDPSARTSQRPDPRPPEREYAKTSWVPSGDQDGKPAAPATKRASPGGSSSGLADVPSGSVIQSWAWCPEAPRTKTILPFLAVGEMGTTLGDGLNARTARPMPAAATARASRAIPILLERGDPSSTDGRGSRRCARVHRSGGSRWLKTSSRSRISGTVFLQETVQSSPSLAQVDADRRGCYDEVVGGLLDGEICEDSQHDSCTLSRYQLTK